MPAEQPDEPVAGTSTNGPEDVIAIAAVARNGVIGADGDIPWRIPEDWARFKRFTLGHVLVMGRKTFDSIGRPLPGRTTVVVTRDPSWSAAGVQVHQNVPDALAAARRLSGGRPVYLAGGAEIYRAAWEATTVLELTEVDQAPPGDAVFPAVDPAHWRCEHRDDQAGYAYVRYRRIPGSGAATP